MPNELKSEWQSLGTFEITAYTWTGDETKHGGYPIENRTIATDPCVIPPGTEVMIDGNIYIAEDEGGAIKGNIIDLYIGLDEQTAIDFGRQHKEVFVLKGE